VQADLPSQRGKLRRKIDRATPLPSHLKSAALQALERLPEGNAICHGDFHPDNIILSPRGPVIIDWLDATRGNPLADVARTSILLTLGHLHVPGLMQRQAARVALALFHALYLRRYMRLSGSSPASRRQLAAWKMPVAAGRLDEGIEEEETHLFALVNASL
jgi:aminoglycoside phosphotransferase (APT) family kinase protein